ncbi:hypothetical protein [Amycolatopsis saalfeldensis]|uniref:Uncharacterized protein n=1 Tax=Amycolatopsis saalfeldensis TaxID=394193 RepID=A0A1H8YPE1_9PSEU|nr:hypothetical protein [Amycolatopsis saalfeldensis]SEP53953.1 hypothetical protein SAMN04489732_1348 [Amycolatopsis saalfeldensis]
MASAREVRARLRKKAADERRQREEAAVLVNEAAAIAVKARADHNAALRKVFEAALKPEVDEERAAMLRELLDAALAGSPKVVEAERAAGRAVLAAGVLKVPQTELAEVTEQRVEVLRRWTQLVPQDKANSGTGSAAEPGAGASEPSGASGLGSRPGSEPAEVDAAAVTAGPMFGDRGDVAAAG